MAKDHKYHNANIVIDSALPREQVLDIAGRLIDTLKKTKIEAEIENGFVARMKNWTGLADVMQFAVTSSPAEHGTRTHTEILQYTTEQSTIWLIPIGPKTMGGYSQYKRFMTGLAQAVTAADPQARVTLTEIG